MSQPRDFGFTEEHAMLKQAARRFFHDKLPTQQLHKLVADEYAADREPRAKWNAALWQEMVQLGWPALTVPEVFGGSGMSCLAAAALIEEAGFAALPSPLLTTLQACAVLNQCDADRAAPYLKQIAAGRAFALALQGAVRAQKHSGGLVLNGSVRFVQDAQKCNSMIVKAELENGFALCVVDLNANGVTITPDHIVDLTRDQAHIEFHNADANNISSLQSLDGAMPSILTLLAADMVGAGEWQLQTTVEYAKTRVQFDKPIGAFQAVKHPLVDLMIMLDGARALVYNAACAIDHEPEKALRYAHAAKAAASEMAAFASRKSVQLHGGIGFTWECFVHLYVKRQKHSQVLYGDAMEHRRALAALVIDY